MNSNRVARVIRLASDAMGHAIRARAFEANIADLNPADASLQRARTQRDELRAAQQDLERLRRMHQVITRREWSGPGRTCPVCRAVRSGGHLPRCMIGEALQEINA